MISLKSTRRLGWADPSVMREHLALHPERWNADNSREQRYTELAGGRSVLLLFNTCRADFYLPHFHPANKDLWELLVPVLTQLQRELGPGYWCRALLAELPPGRQIKPHIDPGWGYTFPLRFHWVVQTNPQTSMMCDGQELHFQEGEIWSFNNKELHSAANLGSEPRVHAVMDFLPAEPAQFCRPLDDRSREGLMLNAIFRFGL